MRDDYPLQYDTVEKQTTLPRHPQTPASGGESAAGSRRGSRHGGSKPSFNCPEMRYNKFQMDDLRQVVAILTEAGGGTSGGAASSAGSGVGGGANHEQIWEGAEPGAAASTDHDDWDDPNAADATIFWQHAIDATPLHVRLTVDSDVRDIRRLVRQLLNRVHQKEERNRVAMEWRVVGRVLDRLFFFVYLFVILSSLVFIFAKTRVDNNPKTV